MLNNKVTDRQEELRILRDWCIAVLRFIHDRASEQGAGISPRLQEVAENGIESAFKRRDIRGLKTASRDLLEWVNGFPDQIRNDLDEILRTEFGFGLKTSERDRNKEIAGILKREFVNDEDEYRLLESRIDEIYADETKKAELERINRILLAFGKR
jgi:hypothetical protein